MSDNFPTILMSDNRPIIVLVGPSDVGKRGLTSTRRPNEDDNRTVVDVLRLVSHCRFLSREYS